MTRPLPRPSAQGKGPTGLLSGEERRRSQRVVIRIPVTVTYVVAEQKVTFSAVTASVNDHGAMLVSPRTLGPDSTLELQNDSTRGRQQCRVTRTPVESNEGYMIPVEFTTAAPDFWRISFPPPNWKPVDE